MDDEHQIHLYISIFNQTIFNLKIKKGGQVVTLCCTVGVDWTLGIE